MTTTATITAAFRVICVCLLGALGACATARLGSPSYQQPAQPPPMALQPLPQPLVSPVPRALITWDTPAKSPDLPYPNIIWSLPAIPAAAERLGPRSEPKPSWRSECDASSCFRTIMFDDGKGWDYVAGTLRVLDDRGGLHIHVSSAVTGARLRVDKGQVFTFRCSSSPATCSLPEAAARRLAAAIRRGNKLFVEVKVDRIERKRIGVPKAQRVQVYPSRVLRKELDLASFHALPRA